MIAKFTRLLLVSIVALADAAAVHAADPAPFDLTGPEIEVAVTRDGTTLPISQVPNLAVGDHLWIKADMPPSQSAHYVMVAAFLRGATNPPPPNWFFPCQTWTRQCAQEGMEVTVPPAAQQLLLFLAPETGGDIRTLIGAVRGRPGAFVRASQDLNQATLDRSRLDAYLAAIHEIGESDQATLNDAVPLLARSLAIKVDAKCLDNMAQFQAACLMQGENSLILNDGHSTSIVEGLTSGPASDLAMEASSTPQLNYGLYSPYVASVLDIARILDSFLRAVSIHPGAGEATGQSPGPDTQRPALFQQSEIGAGRGPAGHRAVAVPPLHAVDAAQTYCARRTPLVIALDGAPLAFSTHYAHDLTLSLAGKDGKVIELAARADARRGGFVVDNSGLAAVALSDATRGSLHGYWGFEKYHGPSVQLASGSSQKWSLDANDAGALIVGREDTVRLRAASNSCVAGVTLQDSAGTELPLDWKPAGADAIAVRLPLQQAQAGVLTLQVTAYGATHPQALPLHAFAEAGHLSSFTLRAGDTQGILRGTRLDEVASMTVKGMVLLPGQLSSSQGVDQLPMMVADASTAVALKQGEAGSARVTLKDGRVLDLNIVVDAPRPRVTLIGKSVQLSASGSSSNIRLADQDELPHDARLIFSLRTQSPAAFTYDEKIEVATVNNPSSAILSFDNGGITLEDAQVAVAVLDPAKTFGASAFGPLQFRVTARDAAGDWQPLATLVRLPALSDLKCPATRELACKLSGSSLFLVDWSRATRNSTIRCRCRTASPATCCRCRGRPTARSTSSCVTIRQ